MYRRLGLPVFALAAVVFGASVALAPAAGASTGIAGITRQVGASGTAGFVDAAASAPGSVDSFETPSGANSDGQLTDRSSSGAGGVPVGAVSQPKSVTVSTPGLVTSFAGLNHFDQRFGSSAGSNQFSLEPPDQGLCVGTDGSGHPRVVEAINDLIEVFDTKGTRLLANPTALNHFFGFAPAIVRSPPPLTFGPFVTDPSCLFDAATGRWFVDVLTLDTFPHVGSDGAQHFTGTNHLDLAVSNTSNPTGSWTVYHIPVQDDGTQGTPDHGCSAGTSKATPLPTNPHACLGDYPHIGSDTNGIYLTTNEYSLFGNEFKGAQVYAFSKTELESGASSVSVTQFNTHGLDTFGFALNGFTLWPSHENSGGGDPAAGGTEYFLSTNGAAEAHDLGDGKSTFHPSTQLLVWALSNTTSLNGTPSLTLANAKVDVGLYTLPPAAEQKSGNQPLRNCLNNNPCSVALEGIKDPFAEKSASLDSNDTRMQQVTFINGELWGAIDTGLSVSSNKQAGIEWFRVSASNANAELSATLKGNGYVGLGNDNLTYPAIGIVKDDNAGVAGVMGFTVVGSDFYPSAGYALIDGTGVGDVHVAAAGVGPDDGFSDYKLFGNPPGTTRPRWGDYGAAVVVGNSVWMASEYIGQSCDLATYERTNFRCDSTRSALANWDTRISEVSLS